MNGQQRVGIAAWIVVAIGAWYAAPFALNCRAAEPADTTSPPTAVNDAEIAKLIDQLGHERFFAREQAQAALAKLGYEAFDALMSAQDHEDIEIASRAKYLVRLVKVDWVLDGDPAELKQALENYEQLDQTARVERIRMLAEHLEPAWIAALCRLARFERIPVLSKQAAIHLIEQQDLPAAAWPARGELILAQVGRSSRPSAEWLRLYVASQTQPEQVIDTWSNSLTAEEEVLAETPDLSDGSIVGGLVRYQIRLLERLDRQSEVEPAIARLVANESGETESLIRLVDWLVARKSWTGLERLQERFAGRFAQEPLLAYSLAGARRAQDDSAGADKLTAVALALQPADGHQHLQTALWLRERGWLDWCERELRRTIEIGPAESNDTLTAQFRLADMLHDRLADNEAGEVLQQAIDALDKAAQAAKRPAENLRALEQAKRFIASRMHYYLSCHFQRQKNRAQEAEHLQAGVKDDPTDADILIGLYRLPDQSDAERAEVKRLIDEATAKFKAQIAQNPNEPNGYNQLAWLLSNTDRDLAVALELSQQSLKLKPAEPGYLDTLGRCYFALKDYPNAVKFQEQAVAGEPHSGQMKRQLELFRRALSESSGAPPS